MSIEAMKQALEALESVLCDPDGNVCWQGSYADRDIIGDALDIFRTAIAEAEKQERFFCERCGKRLSGGIHTCTPPSEAKKQEPVATLEELEQEIYENTREFVSRRVMDWMLKRYYTTSPAAPVQESVGLIESLKDAQPCCGQYEICHRACTPRGKFLGHRDAQREWVGLTLEDKKEYLAGDFGGSRADAMDWTDKRLKEKNT